jgi:hypothetical protein
MRINSNIPKTFSIYATKNNRKGYLRFVAVEKNMSIKHQLHLVKDIKNASKFVNFDNVKKKALSYKSKYKLDEVKVIDINLSKTYNVKTKKNQK